MISQQDKSAGVELLVCTGPSSAIKGLSAVAAAKEQQYLEMNLEKRQRKEKRDFCFLCFEAVVA